MLAPESCTKTEGRPISPSILRALMTPTRHRTLVTSLYVVSATTGGLWHRGPVDAIRGVALHHRCRADRGGSPGTDDRRRIVRLAWVANQVSFVGSATADAAPARIAAAMGSHARAGWRIGIAPHKTAISTRWSKLLCSCELWRSR
jgi:hypothetical protein